MIVFQLVLLVSLLCAVSSFLHESGCQKLLHPSSLLHHHFSPASLEEDVDELQIDDKCRRKAIAACFAPLILFPSDAVSKTFPAENLDCLRDLPPLDSDCVRLYLCRHGQTENNRLRKVQGARVDPPINNNGYIQARNAGKAMSRAHPRPQIFYCSDLQRSRMTAELASSEINPKISPRQVELLREVDFGPVAERQSVALAKAGMDATVAAWAIGNIDCRPDAGGESGREVLNRAAEALKFLGKEAETSPNGCLGAVSHSAFLRILVGMILDEPLSKAASLKIENGSITILDMPKQLKTRIIGSTSRLLGGPLSQAPKDFKIEAPICHVVRINESRHLPEIPAGKLLQDR
eukprot:scaffold20430_cov120-Cylindrotheca_fusiformis.AAC.3